MDSELSLKIPEQKHSEIINKVLTKKSRYIFINRIMHLLFTIYYM